MDVGLTIAGLLCVVMAIGHQALGVRWVIPHLTEEHFPATPFGSGRGSVHMIRVSWYIVTIFAVSVGGILLTLAWDAGVDPKTVLLRWFAVMWLAATAMTLWVIRERLRNPLQFFRLPVPLFWVIVAVLCWKAST